MGFRKLPLLSGLALLLTAAPVTAGTITTTTLPNGLQVRIHADENLTLAKVNLLFAAGRANDPDSLAGLAHVAEHLLTESSRDHPDGGLIRQSALYSTYCNAYTSNSYMDFITQCLPRFLPQVLALEVERFQGASRYEAGFERKKSVVLAEMAYRQRRTPWAEHLEDLYQACYQGHPMGEAVIGTRESVTRITIADYQAFCRRNIQPQRATLIISGPLNAEQTMSQVDSLFRFGPRALPEHLELPPYPPIQASQVVGDDVDFTGVRVSTACRVPLHDEATTVLAYSLPYLFDFGLGVASVPGEAMIEMGVFFDYNRPPPDADRQFGYIYADFDPDQTAQYALGALWRRLDEEMDDLADPELFAKRQQRALASAGDFGTDADAGAAMVSGNSTVAAERAREVLTALTYDDLATFIATYLTPGRAAVGITHGRDSERPQAIELAARSKHKQDLWADDALSHLSAAEIEPVLAAYAAADLQAVTWTTLGNGLPFVYLELPGLSQVRLGGTRVLPPLKMQRPGDKPGIAQLYNLAVTYDDRQHRDPDEPDYRPRKLPYELSFKLTPGKLAYTGQAREAKVARLAFHLERRLASHEFNQECWFRLIRSGRHYLADRAAEPAVQALGWRLAQVLGAKYQDLGYWQPEAGIMEKIRYQDLVKVHKKVAGEPGQTVLYGVGSLPQAEVAPLLEKALGQRGRYREFEAKLPATTGPDRVVGRIVSDLTRGDVLLSLSFPVMPQAEVAGELLLKTVLSQHLTSRLREIEGLTYAVWVKRRALSGLTLWEVHVTCRPGQAHDVLASLREELALINTSGFSADEIARARLSLTGQLIRAFSDQDEGFALLASLAASGPWLADLLPAVATWDAGSVNELAVQVLRPDRFAFTALGPLLDEDIERFGAE